MTNFKQWFTADRTDITADDTTRVNMVKPIHPVWYWIKTHWHILILAVIMIVSLIMLCTCDRPTVHEHWVIFDTVTVKSERWPTANFVDTLPIDTLEFVDPDEFDWDELTQEQLDSLDYTPGDTLVLETANGTVIDSFYTRADNTEFSIDSDSIIF